MNFLRLPPLSIGQRMALALALPLVGLLCFAFWGLLGPLRVAGDMQALHNAAQLTTVVSRLVHELQRERGVSAAYMGSGGAGFDEWRAAQERQTDAQRDAFEETLQAGAWERLGVLQHGQLARVRAALSQLETWRREAAALQVNEAVSMARYTGAIRELIAMVQDLHLLGTDPQTARTIAAYVNLLQAKELTGQMRALGAVYFAAHHADGAQREQFLALSSRATLFQEQYRLFATPEQVQWLDAQRADVRMDEVAYMGAQVFAAPRKDALSASRWFEVMTWQIDQLKQIEDRLAHGLMATSLRSERDASLAVLYSGLAILLALALTALLAGALARSILQPMRRMTAAMNQLAAEGARVEEVHIVDQARGDEMGDMARAALVFRDNVMRIAQAEERLRGAQTLRLHHKALQSIAQGVLIVDGQGKATYCNPAFEVITGRDAQQVLGREPVFLWTDDSARAQLWGSAGAPCEQQVQRLDGSVLWYEATVNPVENEAGVAAHQVLVLRDITEQRRVEQEMRIAATAFESLHGMIVTDANGFILRVNQAFTAMMGYTAEEVVGRRPSMFQSGRHDAQFYDALWQALRERGAWFGELWDRRKNGEVYPLLQSISAVRGSGGEVTHYVAAFADISERKEAEERIRHLAFYDPLTHLPNRRLLLERLQHALVLSERTANHGALMFIDLDQFKALNDTLGHDVGDLLLVEVARRLQAVVRASDTAARQGGDEFVVMLEDLAPNLSEAAYQARAVAEKLLCKLNEPYLLAGHELRNTPSIGVTMFRGQQPGLDALMRQADLAMYQSKAAGRNALHFFDPQMQVAVNERVRLDADLRRGLERGDFCLHYQKQVDGQGRMVGAEALLRWQHPQRGTVMPDEFIDLAEETGLILPLGQWVLQAACAQLAQWGRHAATAALVLSVNVSARQFRQPEFVATVLQALQGAGADPARLRLELTESLMLHDVQEVVHTMEQLRAHGIGFALDDFGTGYSSLSYLRRLPLDVLKIDRAFVRDILAELDVAAIVHGIVNLARTLGLDVVAEGVEQQAQFDMLLQQGCTEFQGLLFGRAVPAPELALTTEIS